MGSSYRKASAVPRNLRGLGEADLARAAARFIHPKDVAWLVVGDLAEIEPAVRDLGFGEVVRLQP